MTTIPGASSDASDGPSIHPMAVVHPSARLGRRVRIGPFSTVGPNVELQDDVVLHSHAVVDGHTVLGEGVQVFPFAAVGLVPQDLKYDGSPTRLVVGARTIIRESATLQPGSVGENCGVTSVGSDCLIMAYCHVAHDCVIGDRVIMANGTQVAGHCRIDDFAILGGMTTIHQFVRVGTRAFTGAATRLQQDLPPFLLADGHPARLIGLNAVGLRRAGISSTAIEALKRAYRALFRSGRYKEALDALSRPSPSPSPSPTSIGMRMTPSSQMAPQDEANPNGEVQEVRQLVEFLRTSKRGVTRARARGED
ncbi:MAG: acyl-ACP--UDP-N-acetylglucosamine O-acyltransferase [Deltaproteobacteria bacterium]|nr:acyl-ACP--UDP-N-acetylglucosamine O-acyltransferase [Deltaproteobacteria bacterium]